MLEWHKKLIALRKTHPVLRSFNKNDVRVSVTDQSSFTLHRQTDDGLRHLVAFFNLSDETVVFTFPYRDYRWVKLLDSRDQMKPETGITGIHPDRTVSGDQIVCSPQSVVLYQSSKL